MGKLRFALLLAALGIVPTSCHVGERVPPVLLITDVTIVSAHLAESLAGQDVLIRNGRIAEIGTGLGTRRTKAIDGEGMYLTPGLMDAHHHVSYAPGLGALGYGVSAEFPELSERYIEQQPRSLLYYGVTQILDPSPLDSWRQFMSRSPRPHLFRCGEIPNPGGYPLNQMPWDGIKEAFAYRIGDEEPESIVRRIAADGAICVKLYIEDGFGDESSWPIPGDETIARIRAAARENGLLLYAHANAIDMQRIALRNEVDVIGHGLWNWQWAEDPESPPVIETLDIIRSTQTGFVPTHRVMAGIAGELRSTTLDDPALVKVAPQELLIWYSTHVPRAFTEELTADFSPDMSHDEMADVIDFGHRRAQRATAYLAEQGYPLLLGSDCPGSPTVANQPGLCTYQEMLSMAEAGVTPQQILEAATINNARQFGLAADYGTVEVGKIANLLLLSANPVDDVAAWDSIVTVILDGRPHDRESFAAN